MFARRIDNLLPKFENSYLHHMKCHEGVILTKILPPKNGHSRGGVWLFARLQRLNKQIELCSYVRCVMLAITDAHIQIKWSM